MSRLDEARQFWTVGRNDDGTHKYLVVAKEKTTMAFELGAEMAETDDDIFIKNETTIAAGELFSDGISIQIQVANNSVISMLNFYRSHPCLSCLLAKINKLKHFQLIPIFPFKWRPLWTHILFFSPKMVRSSSTV
jgi:hypothetical protein